MPTYTETWNIAQPDGSEARSLGDDRIREMKRALDERLNTDHVKPNSETGITTVGYHRKCTLIEQASNPSIVDSAGIMFVKDADGFNAMELFYIDDDGNVTQFTNAGKLRAESLGGVYPAANVAALASILAFVYPVGCIYHSEVATNPATVFGFGTWVSYGAGRTLVGVDPADVDFDTAGETGGAKTVDLRHNHSGYTGGVEFDSGAGGSETAGALDTKHKHSIANDLSATQTVMNPYTVVYRWKRTA